MGYVIKNSIKSTLISLTGAALGFVTILIAVRFMDKVEFGFQQNLIKNVSLISTIAIFGVELSLILLGQRYDRAHPKRGAFLRFSFTISALVTALIIVLLLLFRSEILEKIIGEDRIIFEQYYYYFPVFILLMTLVIIMTGYFKSIYESSYAFFMLEVIVRLLLLLNTLLFINDFYSFNWFVFLLPASYFLIFIFMVIRKNVWSDIFRKSNQKLDFNEKKYIVKYAVIHLSVGLFFMLFFLIDTLLFPFLLEGSLEKNAVFSLGLFVVSIMRMPVRVLGQVTTPEFVKFTDAGNMLKVKELYSRSAINLQLLITLCLLLWLINMDSIEIVLNNYKAGYENLNELIPIMLVGVWLEMSFGLSHEIISVSKFAKMNFWFSIIFIIFMIVINIIMIKKWGVTGAAYAFTITMGISVMARYFFNKIKFQISPFSFDTIKILIIFSFILGINRLIPTGNNIYADIIIRTILSSLLYIALSYFWKVGDDVHHIFHKLKNKLIP